MQPLISVIIPVYNAADRLAACLDSIIKQNRDNLEIILINDGSTDDSEKVIKNYMKDYPFISLFNQKNKGAAAARNVGLKNAKGKYVSFIDADDTISEGLYDTFIQNIKKDDIDLFMFNGTVYNKDERKASFFSNNLFKPGITEKDTVTYKNIANFFYGNQSICNKIYRLDFLRKNHLLMKEGSIFEDTLFNFETIINAKSMRFTYKSFYNYLCDNDNSVTKQIGENVFCIFDIFNDMEKASEKAGLKDFFAYAIFQLEYEKLIETISMTKESVRKELFAHSQIFMRQRIKKLNPDIYVHLVNINYCFSLLNYTYSQFCDTLLLSRAEFKFSDKKPKKPRFSIIIPMYNVMRFLPLCMKSVINQTFTDFEVICVDDGSPDNCKDYIAELAKRDARIKLIVQENQGLGNARNNGTRAAKGEYIMFLDSDDWLSLTALEKIDETIRKNPTDVGMFGRYQFTDETMQLLTLQCFKLFENFKTATAKDIAPYFFVEQHSCNKWYKRSFFIDNDLFFPEGVYFEDVLTHTKALILAKSIAFCQHYVYYYRIRTNSIMNSTYNEKKINDLMQAFTDTIQWLQQENQLEVFKPSLAKFISIAVNRHLQKTGQKFGNMLREKLNQSPEIAMVFHKDDSLSRRI